MTPTFSNTLAIWEPNTMKITTASDIGPGLCIVIVYHLRRVRQNGCHFADDFSKFILLYTIDCIFNGIPLKFAHKCPIYNILICSTPVQVQIMDSWINSLRPSDA